MRYLSICIFQHHFNLCEQITLLNLTTHQLLREANIFCPYIVLYVWHRGDKLQRSPIFHNKCTAVDQRWVMQLSLLFTFTRLRLQCIFLETYNWCTSILGILYFCWKNVVESCSILHNSYCR